MKKHLFFLAILGLLSACSDQNDTSSQTETAAVPTPSITDYADKTFEFDAKSLTDGCTEDSKLVCAVNAAIKCSINPKHGECDKKKMPKFVFMEDESLERPTKVSYKINKMKPLAGGMVELYTESSCNASWFGLCEGNIIYVMAPVGDDWAVKDIYAMQVVN